MPSGEAGAWLCDSPFLSWALAGTVPSPLTLHRAAVTTGVEEGFPALA